MDKLAMVAGIESRIYHLRGRKVMLDRDLAALYCVSTKVLNQAVRRHINRFPEDFMFQLNLREVNNLRSQFVTSSWGGLRYKPFAFTEQGIAMLSSVLNSERAILANIQIMRAFVNLRRGVLTYSALRRRMDGLERKYDSQFSVVFEAIKRLLEPEAKPKRKIGFGAGDGKWP